MTNLFYTFQGIKIGLPELMLICLAIFVVFLIIRNITMPSAEEI